MKAIEIFSKDDCPLCDKAKELVRRVNAEFTFTVKETTLAPGQPEFERNKNAFPVIVASNGKKIWGNVTEEQVRELFVSLTPPPRIYTVAKFLEALAIVMVFFGFMYGLLGDMWMNLYFFIGGILVFLVGWSLEKHEQRRRKAGRPS